MHKPIVIFTIGTQGDVRPCVALGQGLRRAGYPVRIATSGNFAGLVREAGLEFFPLTADFQAMLEADRSIADRGLDLRAMARIFRERYAQWAVHWADEGLAASEGAGLLLGVSNSTLLAKALSEHRGVPFAIARLQPLTPSRVLPPMVLSGSRERLPGAVSLAAHQLLWLLVWHVMRPAINDIVRPRLGLPRYPWHGPYLGRGALDAKVINGFSRHVLAPPSDWPDSSQVTGYWFFDPPAWTPPADLADFLAAGPKPVYIGFGSMVSHQAAAFTQVVLDGVRKSGQRAVLAAGWGGLEIAEGALDGQIYGLRQAPHDWLFPRMAAAVHHGRRRTLIGDAGIEAGRFDEGFHLALPDEGQQRHPDHRRLRPPDAGPPRPVESLDRAVGPSRGLPHALLRDEIPGPLRMHGGLFDQPGSPRSG